MKVSPVKQSSAGVGRSWMPKLSPRAKIMLRWAGIVLSWLPLALFVFFTGIALFWTLLAAVLLRVSPAAEAVPLLLIFLGAVGGFGWLAGRAAGSLRNAGLFIGAGLLAILLAGGAWAVFNPDGALFLARQIAWANSNVKDYLLFPERTVLNGPSNFHFKDGTASGFSPVVEYTSQGAPMQAPLVEFLQSTHTTSFIVIKDDAILYEGYFNGYQRDSIVTSFSMAKSFTSALVGIAIAEGHIGGVNDPVIKYLPELKGRGLDELTIRHLLNMSTGIGYVTDDELSGLAEFFQFTDDGLSYSYPDLRTQALNLKAGKVEVGAEFNYNNYHPQLLGLILERTTGMPVAAYLQEKIWKPLGMEYPASWSLDSEKDGFELMTAGINGRAIDFARFGRLFLNKGNWQGKQIIPEAWIIESTAPDPTDQRVWHSDLYWKEAGGYYRYLWWGIQRSDGGYDYEAHGHDGQRIYVAPQDGMLIVRFGLDEGGVDSWSEVFRGLLDQAVAGPQVQSPAPAALGTAAPEQMGFDSSRLAEGLLQIQAKKIPINSLTMIYKDSVFLDAYFYPYDGSIYHDLASVTKSVTTTLIGIAAGQGKLNLDQTVLSFFPGRSFASMDERKERITVRDLASMRSGLSCGYNDDEPVLKEMRATSDWVQYALDRPMKNEPGKYFSYCGMSSYLLSAILTQVTGMSALDFAKQNLFGPLGIEQVHWPADPNGINHGWGDLSLHPSDMGKLGVLFLNNGRWGDRQVVPAAWIAEAFQSYAANTGRKENYGYGWWISPPNEDPPYVLAAGNGGQRLQIFRDRGLIFVTTGSGFEFDQVVPYITNALNDSPLPANPAGEAQLKEALQVVSRGPAPKPVPAFPQIAASVSGKTFVFGPECPLRAVRLDLDRPAEAVMTLDVRDEPEPRVSRVGLDGLFRPSQAGRPAVARGEWWSGDRFGVEYYEGPGITFLKLVLEFRGDGTLVMDISGIASCEGTLQ
ncbi:MAG: serine hydrolase [Bacteroidota bacterium]